MRVARSNTKLANRQKRFYPGTMYVLPANTFPRERTSRDSSDFFARSGVAPALSLSLSLGISASRYTFSRGKRAHKFSGLIPTVYALDVFVGSAGLTPASSALLTRPTPIYIPRASITSLLLSVCAGSAESRVFLAAPVHIGQIRAVHER